MASLPRPRPLVLVILDGFGERAERADNAVRLARSPALSDVFARYPHGLIGASGPDVGLPPGQMGNSEVGHLNLGAGRIALMDITRIDAEIEAGTLGENQVLRAVASRAVASGGHLHLLGLVSDGGVHSSLRHLSALIDMFRKGQAAGARIVLHAFLDGRDVQPGTAPRFLAEVERQLAAAGGVIGTVSGRYWAMDRD
ncbi:MAG: 2,3-bisphosphoglycerate-independent phosphoglycerate mutase, partial [Polyangiaceae bacterium]